MGLRCRIHRDNEDRLYVTNPDGSPSQLFEDLLIETANQHEALNIWAQTQTDLFKTISGVSSPESLSVGDVVKFYNAISASKENKLSADELQDVKNVMAQHGFSSLSDLHKELTKIFKKDGIIASDNVQAITSGLYSQEDLKSLNLDEINTALNKIEGQLLNEDIFNDTSPKEFFYKSTEDKRTFLGTAQAINENDILEEVRQGLKDFTNPEQLALVVSQLPYESFKTRFFDDPNYRKEIQDRLTGLKHIPQLTIDPNGDISVMTDKNYTTLRNTILTNQDHISIEANLEYLQSVDDDLWDDYNTAIKHIIESIEQKAVKLNIDIIGLSEMSENKSAVISVIDTLNEVLKNPTDENQRAFALEKSKLLPVGADNLSLKVPQQYSGLNIVTVASQLSNNDLFEQHGLVKVDDNLYHKVAKNTNISDMYEFLYDKILKGKITIPEKYLFKDYQKLANKERFLQNLAVYTNLRDTGLDIQDKERISLIQQVFNHQPLVKPEPLQVSANLSVVKTDSRYLQTKFISDFYHYILNQKSQDSSVYRNVLSKYDITDQDITMSSPIESLEGIKYKQELEDYIRMKKDMSMDYLAPETKDFDPNLREELQAVNFPESLTASSKYGVKPILDKGFIVFPNTVTDNYLTHEGEVFKKIFTDSHNSVFEKYPTPSKNSTYYSEPLRFSPDKETAGMLLKKYSSISESNIVPVNKIGSTMLTEQLKTKAETDVVQQTADIIDSNLDLLPLQTEQQELDSYLKIGDCG